MLHTATALQLSCPPIFQALLVLFYFSSNTSEFIRLPFLSGAGDYVPLRTARAKGVAERGVVNRHALPLTVPAIAAMASVNVATLLINVAVIEYAFAHPRDVPGDQRPRSMRRDVPVLEGLVIEGVFLIVARELPRRRGPSADRSAIGSARRLTYSAPPRSATARSGSQREAVLAAQVARAAARP